METRHQKKGNNDNPEDASMPSFVKAQSPRLLDGRIGSLDADGLTVRHQPQRIWRLLKQQSDHGDGDSNNRETHKRIGPAPSNSGKQRLRHEGHDREAQRERSQG